MEEYLLPLRTSCVYYDDQFISESEANEAYEDLLKNTPWEKTAKINRWVTLMELPKEEDCDDNKEKDDNDTKKTDGYRYRDAPGASLIGFPPAVHKLKGLAEDWYNLRNSNNKDGDSSKVEFNVCLLNYYQDGTQRIGWHSDREELGRSTPIASISLGASRQFLIRSKTDGVNDRANLTMTNGSIVIMENICQHKYLHSVPKESDVTNGRINLTFRCKDKDSEGTTAGELEHEKRDHWINQISTEEGALDSTAGAWKNETTDGSTTTTTSGSGDVVFGDNTVFYDPTIHSEEDVLSKSVMYVVKTNIGAESYCAAEMEEVLDMEKYHVLARPFGIAGYIAVCRLSDVSVSDEVKEEDDVSQMESTLLQLRTAHHILRYHDHFDLSSVLDELSTKNEVSKEEQTNSIKNIGSITGEMMYEYYKERLESQTASITSLAALKGGGTFRTSCERVGTGHGFQAPEIERYVFSLFTIWFICFETHTLVCTAFMNREVGGAMSEYYTQIKPKMSDFDVEVRVDVIATNVIVGTQINIDDLSKQRHFLRFRNAVTLKTNLAYAMIRLANINNGDLVVDVSRIIIVDAMHMTNFIDNSNSTFFCNTALLW